MQVKFNSHSIKDTFKKLFLNNVWNNKIIVWKLHSSVVEKSHYLALFFDGYFFFFFFFLKEFFTSIQSVSLNKSSKFSQSGQNVQKNFSRSVSSDI